MDTHNQTLNEEDMITLFIESPFCKCGNNAYYRFNWMCKSCYQKIWFTKNKHRRKGYNENYFEKGSIRLKSKRKEVRLRVISHYSPNLKCQCCGESHYEFLTIDHMNNDGAEHRREIGIGGGRLYEWLIKNNFPEGYQVLCWNCNMSKSIEYDDDFISRDARKRKKNRTIVLKHYSKSETPFCACCGETKYRFLALDHEKGGGRKHQREIKTNIFKWTIRNNYPEGFRVLCHNCNCALGQYHYCPHDKEEKKQINISQYEYPDIKIEDLFEV